MFNVRIVSDFTLHRPPHGQNSFSKFRKNRRQELRHKAYVSKDKGRRSTVEKDRLRLKFLDACKSYVC